MTNSNHFTVPKHVLYQIICTSKDITNDRVFQEKGHSYNMSFRCTIFCPTRVNIVSCIFPLVLPRPIKLSSLAPHSSANTSARWPSAPVFPPPAGVAVSGWWWFSRTAVRMSVFHQPKNQLPFESLTENISYVTTREPADLICDRAKAHILQAAAEESLVNFHICECLVSGGPEDTGLRTLSEDGRTSCYITEAAAYVFHYDFHITLHFNCHKTDRFVCFNKKVAHSWGYKRG